MAGPDKMTPEKREAYNHGFRAGYQRGRHDFEKHDYEANWILRKYDWYCSRCGTKNEQKHDNFCCKCGARMSKEAEYEDN